MKKIIKGILFGSLITTLFFITVDFFTIETKVPKGHVIVHLNIETTKEIKNITLISEQSKQVIQPYKKRETIMIFPVQSEDSFKLCCTFLDESEICSGQYVERGYSPILKITDSKIEIIDSD